ncbi:MAG TPA: SIMPL domain-containing protein, partial [Solirubrobacteraceae bacterium]|nr:SIMPL domain-containing protein [Solirubrobacteraceae bacterium]
MKRFRWILPLALLLLAASAIAGVAQPHFGRAATTAPSTKTITVTGNGTVTSVPDRAEVSFSIDTRAKTATGALSQNADEASKVIAALKAAGVADADIQTSQVSLSPQTTQDGLTIVGYSASNGISVRSAIAAAGKLIDTAVAAGATSVSGPSLSLSDQAGLYRDALKKAVADAKLKAQALADSAGLTLGDAQTITEGSAATPLPMAGKLDAPASTPIQPGTQD